MQVVFENILNFLPFCPIEVIVPAKERLSLALKKVVAKCLSIGRSFSFQGAVEVDLISFSVTLSMRCR